LKVEDDRALGQEGVELVGLTIKDLRVVDLRLTNTIIERGSGRSWVTGYSTSKLLHHGEHGLLEGSGIDEGRTAGVGLGTGIVEAMDPSASEVDRGLGTRTRLLEVRRYFAVDGTAVVRKRSTLDCVGTGEFSVEGYFASASIVEVG
jgi:hypothetical protein